MKILNMSQAFSISMNGQKSPSLDVHNGKRDTLKDLQL